MESPTLQTARLILAPLRLLDAPVIQQLFPQWDVVRYLGSHVPWPYPDDGALTYIRDVALPAVAEGREWHWTIRLTSEPARVIGCISLHDQPENHRGFWLAPQWRGHGYMREACEVINAFWFMTLQRPLMQVPKAVGNEASRRISQREGMRVIQRQDGDFVSGPMEQEIWELTRAEWLAMHGRTSA
ncbi:GNAT family N-acetyltransferase [Pseudomonas petrae]|uniref:GNAT family N-acetyltransferase n=1 Tax=Pseudomonas petrae TaxID=2912190 RepID=A0ABS9I853_9PSED|nr:GNAT family N-acetyltransferase [Pseudomonas petrae]MCF7533648.1 GNAT family N-acetyltransferase [Pseudomonas petrae]MCF7539632.1 GNAT family N-acetyltransferase [Pseudomonas petrae]MCF7543913.1 GNAT family N-acetyltransferase [Pseudomonas petrae]MCF7558079.1 GNAT family N-acetyltransferase [Pseudomonas petrae]